MKVTTKEDILASLPEHIINNNDDNQLNLIAERLIEFEQNSYALDPVYSNLTFGTTASDLVAAASKITFYDAGCMINEWLDSTYIPKTQLTDILSRKMLDPSSIPDPNTSKDNLKRIISHQTSNAINGGIQTLLPGKGFCSSVITDEIKPLLRDYMNENGLSSLSIPTNAHFMQMDNGEIKLALAKAGDPSEASDITLGQIALLQKLSRELLNTWGDNNPGLSDESLIVYANSPLEPRTASPDPKLGDMGLNFVKAAVNALNTGKFMLHITPEGTFGEGQYLKNFSSEKSLYIPQDQLPKDIQSAIETRAKAGGIKSIAEKSEKEAKAVIAEYFKDTLEAQGLDPNKDKGQIGAVKRSYSGSKRVNSSKVKELCENFNTLLESYIHMREENDLSPDNSPAPFTPVDIDSLSTKSRYSTVLLDKKDPLVINANLEAEQYFDRLLNSGKLDSPQVNKPSV